MQRKRPAKRLTYRISSCFALLTVIESSQSRRFDYVATAADCEAGLTGPFVQERAAWSRCSRARSDLSC